MQKNVTHSINTTTRGPIPRIRQMTLKACYEYGTQYPQADNDPNAVIDHVMAFRRRQIMDERYDSQLRKPK